MSAPEPCAPGHYFVDYEIWSCGQAVAWGQLLQPATSGRADDDTVVDAIRQRAGSKHGVGPDEVRIRILTRL